MKKALLIGFARFGSYKENPTQRLITLLNGSTVSGYNIEGAVFPASMAVAKKKDHAGIVVARLVKRLNIEAVVAFGLSSAVKGVRFESVARNWCFNPKYCEPGENNRSLLFSDPPRRKIQLRMADWNLGAVKKDLKSENMLCEQKISEDAGFFCCNALMYLVEREFVRQRIEVPFLFAHTSCTKDAAGEGFDPAKTLIPQSHLRTILEVLLNRVKVCSHSL